MSKRTIYSENFCGQYGNFKLEINAEAPIDLHRESIELAAIEAARIVREAVLIEVVRDNPEAIELARNQKQRLLALFPEGLSYREIPNGYCSDWCCKHLPWFLVSTHVGFITIGWRKRVIQIDWSSTMGTKDADELFPQEDVTKSGKMIHAWSYEKAAEYIKTILAS